LDFPMTFRTRSLVSLIACAALLVPSSAQAEPSPAEISAAKHAFESALDAEAEQRWADAVLQIREAISVKDTPGLRFHLAHCESELGHLLEASLEYERALELLRRGAKAPDVQKLLGPARAALLERLPRLTLEIPSEVQGPRITIDNQPYPTSELALSAPLNPGPHELRVQAAGRRPFQRALTLKEGDRLVLPIVLPLAAAAGGPSDAAPAPAEPPRPVSSSPVLPPPEPERSTSSAKLYLMIGESVLTAAGLGVAIGYAVARGAATNRIDTAQGRIESAGSGNPAVCEAPSSQVADACSELSTAVDDHDRAALLSQIGFVTAGVGAAALLTTWLVYPSSRTRVSGFSVQPVAGFGRLGVIGRF
jgi:hypothetical protein